MKRLEFIARDAAILRGIVDLLAHEPATLCEVAATQRISDSTARGLVQILISASIAESEVVTRIVDKRPHQVLTQRLKLTAKYVAGDVPFDAEELARNPTKPVRSTIRERIEERKRERTSNSLRDEAYQYLQEGPADQRFLIRGPVDVSRAVDIMATALRQQKAVEVSFREGI
jgi:hypothetical protein